jgi:hypothetical protein
MLLRFCRVLVELAKRTEGNVEFLGLDEITVRLVPRRHPTIVVILIIGGAKVIVLL